MSDELKAAVKWWAQRFIEGVHAQHFVMLRNGWTPEELGLADGRLAERVSRYARYHVTFYQNWTDKIEIQPQSEEAHWAAGFIICLLGQVFIYQTDPNFVTPDKSTIVESKNNTSPTFSKSE